MLISVTTALSRLIENFINEDYKMKYTKEHPLRVFSAFSGYDSQCLALERIKEKNPDFDYELVGWSEVEMNAIAAHNAIFPQYKDRNYGDISAISWGGQIPDFDLFTYSFPCQSISSAGKQAGLEEGSGTRSSLLWECRKAIEVKRPKYLMMENVKALLQKKFMPFFLKWVNELDAFGYDSYYHVMNAADYGVPQHRERVFCISIRRDGDGQTFNFPKPYPLEYCIEDILEKDVDEKYYLSEKVLEYFKRVDEDKSHRHNFNPKKN
jgi:DNA (cytosine-5)-methyltransferase 1